MRNIRGDIGLLGIFPQNKILKETLGITKQNEKPKVFEVILETKKW